MQFFFRLISSSVIFVTTSNILYDFIEANSTTSLILNSLGSTPILSLIGSRMLLNMKEAGECGVNEGTNCLASAVSDIQFGSPVRNEEMHTETMLSEENASSSMD